MGIHSAESSRSSIDNSTQFPSWRVIFCHTGALLTWHESHKTEKIRNPFSIPGFHCNPSLGSGVRIQGENWKILVALGWNRSKVNKSSPPPPPPHTPNLPSIFISVAASFHWLPKNQLPINCGIRKNSSLQKYYSSTHTFTLFLYYIYWVLKRKLSDKRVLFHREGVWKHVSSMKLSWRCKYDGTSILIFNLSPSASSTSSSKTRTGKWCFG